ncbi:hypothetical protein I5Q34_26520 [Streptomyces sp. AV19]|uniref:hypothetical protein n=1 Tax=Streptomyces sp. AV19 TaxID=2793068 RepID=UPI0018FEE8FC|nr:hypothetical protein [Streptomyces sp. AV19]MBH1937784.1 hypothetical protein [Streptomyces sp. AV19]MDG4537060.1 hypothetical protein [Streptomyces sp. AV19]
MVVVVAMRNPWKSAPERHGREDRVLEGGEAVEESWPPIDAGAEMRQAFVTARERSLQRDLRVLADRIRTAAEAQDQTAQFHAGVEWAVLYIENTANRLTEGHR